MVVDEIVTGQKRHFNSYMYRYISSCVYEMRIHTHVMTVYLIQGTGNYQDGLLVNSYGHSTGVVYLYVTSTSVWWWDQEPADAQNSYWTEKIAFI